MQINPLLANYQILFNWNLSRAKCFVSMVSGLILSGSVQQHKMALGFSKDIKQKSICARIRSFLKNVEFDYGTYARSTLEISGVSPPFALAIDRTNWKFGKLNINLLVLAVVLSDRFSIPILWAALPKQGNSNTEERIDIMESFIKIFGVKSIASLTADREFIGKDWVEYLMRSEIPFFIRIKENRLVEWGDQMKHIKDFFSHLKGRKKRHIQFQFDGYTLFFAGTRSSNGDLVIILSNQDIGTTMLKIYKKRWTIELLFRHCKTNAFNLEDTHLVHLERIEKLFAVVCAALVICFLVGKFEVENSPTPYKKTVRAPAFSLFRRGFDRLRKLMVLGRDNAFQLLGKLLPALII